MNPNCRLIDGVERNKEAPDTFHIPSHRDVLELTAGQFVKLGVEGFSTAGGAVEVKGERFWVELSQVAIPMAGIVRQSDMAFSAVHGVRDGDTIVFYPQNILGIYGNTT